mgnify:CR=1 FL=1
MKKTYIAPIVEVIKVNAVNMLASSLGINGASVDTSTEGTQLGRDFDSPFSPDIWTKEW